LPIVSRLSCQNVKDSETLLRNILYNA
jgi:hypothetical protein